jgi:U3 small nucleolar RNA-associated protein 21
MVLLNVRTGKMIHVFKCLDKPASKMKSEITCLQASPAIDTIAVGNSKGAVHLVNTRYDKLLFSLGHQSKQGNKSPRITSMSFCNDGSALKYGIAPLAVGRSDGTITVWDLSPPDKDDDDDDAGGVFGDKSNGMGRTVLCEMEHVHSPGGVYKLQYLPQEPLLVSTGSRSNALLMHIFDNPDHSGRILRQRRGHTAPPKCIRYLHPGAGAGGGVLANMADGTDAQACQILSSGGVDRTLRRFSTVRSVLDKEFSQGKGLEKRAKELGMKNRSELLLPPLTALATSEMRSRDWGDLVTIHKDHPFAYVWSSKNGAQSGPILRQDHWNVSAMKKQPPKETHATSVAVSTCGNYALIGTRGGTIYKYNIQSGMTRGTYPLNEQSDGKSGPRKDAGDIRRTFKALEKKMKLSNRASNAEKEELDRIENAKREEHRRLKMRLASHRGHAVTGIAVDSINRTVITVGEDAKLILWSFASHTPHKKSPSQLPAPATKLCHVKDSDLAAIALEDFSIVLFDCAALNIVRRFGSGSRVASHTGPISDVGFSPDGRTLYTSSLDSSIRVWDVPTNACIDWLGFKTPPTSLTVSPTGEFLATTHNEKLGISLWSDRSFFQTVHVDGATSPMEPARMDDPAPIAEIESKDGKNSTNSYFETADPETDEVQISSHETFEKSMGPAVAKEEGLITLSGLPPAHWKNLFHLELVKQRNQPKEPPKKPPSAPFFLQWRPGVNSMGESSGNPEGAGEAKNQDDDGWDAVWSDDDDDNEENGSSNAVVDGLPPIEARGKRSVNKHDEDVPAKKRKVKHHRSHLASLLEKFGDREDGTSFQDVTEYVGTLGPSAIDVSLSGLCNGVHDLEEGLPLLMFAAQWLIEACHSRERFDAVNAYLHRFLYLHSNILAGIDEGVGNDGDDTPAEERQVMHHQRQALATCITALKQAQRSASDALQGEMQNTLCLLRHFSRMI